MPTKGILWDIDGTLVRSGQIGSACFLQAALEVTGFSGPLPSTSFAGQTDQAMARHFLEHCLSRNSMPLPQEEGEWNTWTNRLLQRYLELFAPAWHNHTKSDTHLPFYPGSEAVLQMASGLHISQALLTGNLSVAVQLKLGHLFASYFQFGAYAEAGLTRAHIAKRAVELARQHWGQVKLLVVGDTSHDVAAARVIGAKVLIVGHHLKESDLADHPADYFVDSWESTEVLKQIFLEF